MLLKITLIVFIGDVSKGLIQLYIHSIIPYVGFGSMKRRLNKVVTEKSPLHVLSELFFSLRSPIKSLMKSKIMC